MSDHSHSFSVHGRASDLQEELLLGEIVPKYPTLRIIIREKVTLPNQNMKSQVNKERKWKKKNKEQKYNYRNLLEKLKQKASGASSILKQDQVSSQRTMVLKDEGIRSQDNSHSSPSEEKVLGSEEEVLPYEEKLLLV